MFEVRKVEKVVHGRVPDVPKNIEFVALILNIETGEQSQFGLTKHCATQTGVIREWIYIQGYLGIEDIPLDTWYRCWDEVDKFEEMVHGV